MLRRSSWILVALAGCGSPPPFDGADADGSGVEDATASGESTGSASDDSDASEGDTAEPPAPSSTGVASSGADTGGAETGSTGASTSDTGASTPDYPTPHFPLAVGLQWTYRLTRVDGEIGSACDNQGDEHVMTVDDFDASTGVYTITEDPWCYFAALEYRIADPYVDVNSGAWYHQLLLPPELDATWAAGGASGATYVWDEHHPTYEVAAGTFDDCWRRKQEGYDVWQIYCRDVGMVVSHYAAWGGDSRAELVAF
jgi:hypothetical protein